MNDVLSRAGDFIWRNARLIDRHLFAFHFHDGSGDAVLQALRAYQNADGGFGNALEPDIRCPDSQPVPVQHALEYLEVVVADRVMVQRACDFLTTITTDAGGVPFVLPSVNKYPHAPWWQTDDNPPASLNPTAAIAGLLHKLGMQHQWLARATAFCWARLPQFHATEMHDLASVLVFLRYVPDRERAGQELDRVMAEARAAGLIAAAGAEGYVRKPLDWAPTPEHPCRRFFSDDEINAHLDELIASQGEDGGWNIAWPAISPACEVEWRGWVTLQKLLTLRAYGRL
ncbi:MAG TPA: hypothetical protein VFT66_18800 [Roseiflexaceae bacterium]|nr:hypothetical protein [Roseiflexaceae bacterium]